MWPFSPGHTKLLLREEVSGVLGLRMEEAQEKKKEIDGGSSDIAPLPGGHQGAPTVPKGILGHLQLSAMMYMVCAIPGSSRASPAS